MDLYKIVGPAGECLNGGSGTWSLPTATEPGEWWRIDGPLVACSNGLHLTDASQLARWLPSDGRGIVYRVETDGEVRDVGDKYVAAAVRLLPRSRPAADVAAVMSRASDARQRARLRASNALDRAIPKPWRAYLGSISATLPPAHPGRQYQDARRSAEATYYAALAAADTKYTRTVAREVLP